MADRLTVARPYARAAFEEARQNGGLAPWSESLQTAALVVKDPRVASLLDNPRVTPAELAQLVDEIAASPLGDHGANFVRMLAENHRLGYLPEIAALFDTLKDDAEGMVDVTVTSAAPLDEVQRGKISVALDPHSIPGKGPIVIRFPSAAIWALQASRCLPFMKVAQLPHTALLHEYRKASVPSFFSRI